MSKFEHHSNEKNNLLVRKIGTDKPTRSSLKQNRNKQQNESVTCGCFEIVDNEYFDGCKQIKVKDSQKDNKMERSRKKVRSPRIKPSNVQYAPEGRRGNVYVDEDGRRIYRTSGKGGIQKRYVVMDDGDLKRGERTEQSELNYREETEYETVSEADSEYLVPVRPVRRVDEERPRVLTRKFINENEKPRTATYQNISGHNTGDSYLLRSRPNSYIVERDANDSREYLVRSNRPGSERLIARRVVRERPSSAKQFVEKKEMAYITRPRSEERVVRHVQRPRSEEVIYVERPHGKKLSDDTESKTEAKALQEYIEYPQEYVRHQRTRDVGCQMTTNYVIQQPQKQRKLLRNVQTQTLNKENNRKIKTATHYYQKETVEVIEEPKQQTARTPTPPRIPPPPPPRVRTPEPPRQPKPPKKKKHKKDKERELVVKQPNYPEPVYDKVEDPVQVVPVQPNIYEEPKPSPPKNFEREPTRYAYYEPSEYTMPKSYLPAPPDQDITAESATSGSSDNESVEKLDKFYTVPLKGSTTFYGPYYKKQMTFPPKRKSKNKKRRRKSKPKPMYEHPRYVEMPARENTKEKPIRDSSTETKPDPIPPMTVEAYLRKIHNPPFHVKDKKRPRSSLRRPNDKTKREPRGPVQINDYAAKLPRGPAFYLEDSPPVNPSDLYSDHPVLMYVNPDTERVEPLKYSMEIKPKRKNGHRNHDDPDEDTRYVVIPGFEEHAAKPATKEIVDNSDQQPTEEPLVVIEDSMSPHTKILSLKSPSDGEDTYLTPVSLGPYPEKSAKGKAHMVRVGGGWMKVEHHRNHHTPLKIYEIPRDANDDKFLYIKSRFNPNKKEVPIAYKKYREEIVRG